MAALLTRSRNTEKTSAVVEPTADEPAEENASPAGHGRNSAAAFTGAGKVEIPHQNLKHGDCCPECGQGNVYVQKEPRVLVRIVGQAPLAATVYSLERLRCGACGQVFTAEEPEGVAAEKYDETAAAMIAQLKYGSGIPFYRLERLEEQLGIPLPAATQWEIVEEEAEVIKPARDELIRQAANGEVLHNDDTGMRVLKLEREPGDQRTGVFTSGIVSTAAGRQIALYFTGRQHAGENIADVLKQRARESGPAIQMCDALSWNAPKLPGRRGVAGGPLSRPRKTAGGGGGAELPRGVPACVGTTGRGGPQRCPGTRVGHDAGRAAAFSPAAQPADPGCPARLAGSTVRGTESGAELGSGKSDHVSAAALEAADVVSASGRGPSGHPLRTRFKKGGVTPELCVPSDYAEVDESWPQPIGPGPEFPSNCEVHIIIMLPGRRAGGRWAGLAEISKPAL